MSMSEQGLTMAAREPLHLLSHTRQMMIQQLLCALGRNRERLRELQALSDKQLADKWTECFDA